ncbi:hypothetical protein WR25_12084 isoform A [Diploscapter pachys]|uniref:Calponin-homology (CH) domain-containing protein n=2 Tax=Diploscapter pachys TaxID=2018661 RepID=A0A2A2K0D4_9BILA|nr:hypothetical protein WR25_12084 isoform A [Diploscapter pachys]
MLFSGGSQAKSKKDDKKERRSSRDEKYEIQENVFMRWANSLLANDPIKDFKDLADIKYIAPVVQLVTGNNLPLTGERLDDCHAILQALSDLKTVPQDFVDSQQKAVLNVWWTIIKAFWKNFAPKPFGEEKLMEAIKDWCLEATKGNESVCINDFTSSWRDGHAFNALLHSIDHNLVNLKKLDSMSAIERIDSAFGIAEAHFRASRFLTPKELHSEHLDSRSVVVYLMTLFLSVKGTNQQMDTVQPPLMQPSTSRDPNEPPPPPVPPHHSAAAAAAPSAPVPPVHSSAIEQTSPPHTPLHGSPMLQANYPVDEDQQSLLQQQIQLIQTQHAPLTATTSGGSDQKAHTQKSDKSADLENTEVRSRKSSSSSHKSSSKSKRTRKEELAAEFETALEQVLAWLLEAEEELATLTDKQRTELSAVRSQFNDFEQFMASLTDSQDTVGKVLHRGQVLCSKADTEEEKEAIQKQLQVVNTQWEELRALAMDRQAALQSQLNALQVAELQRVEVWLTETERMIDEAPPLAATQPEAIQQIDVHEKLQNRVDAFQEKIDSLSTFVAVVDEGDVNDEAVATLEIALQSVGNRWQKVCEWAEKRAAKLDGLAELCEQTEKEFEKLNDWLKAREHELLGLKSAHHLEDADQVNIYLKYFFHHRKGLFCEVHHVSGPIQLNFEMSE